MVNTSTLGSKYFKAMVMSLIEIRISCGWSVLQNLQLISYFSMFQSSFDSNLPLSYFSVAFEKQLLHKQMRYPVFTVVDIGV